MNVEAVLGYVELAVFEPAVEVLVLNVKDGFGERGPFDLLSGVFPKLKIG